MKEPHPATSNIVAILANHDATRSIPTPTLRRSVEGMILELAASRRRPDQALIVVNRRGKVQLSDVLTPRHQRDATRRVPTQAPSKLQVDPTRLGCTLGGLCVLRTAWAVRGSFNHRSL